MKTVYHVTRMENADEIMRSGFAGGWGDAGFGVYFYGQYHNANEYLSKGGWDGSLNPDSATILAVLINESELDFVTPEPDWPNPDDYEDVLWYRMDDSSTENWRPSMEVAYPKPADTTQWQLFGAIEIAGTERSIWRLETEDGNEVFQITTGDEPTNRAGYFRLDTLLKLKGVSLSDVAMAGTPGTTVALADRTLAR